MANEQDVASAPAPATAEATPPETTHDDGGYGDFADIFNELAAADSKPVQTAAAAPAATAAAEGAGAPAPSPASPAAPPVAASEQGATGAPAPTTPPAPAETPDQTIARLSEQIETMRRAAPPAAPVAAPAAEPPAPAPIPQPSLTAEQQAAVREFEEQYPDIHKALAIQRNYEYQLLTRHIYQQIEKVYGAPLQQVLDESRNIAQTMQVSAIESVHEDYGQIYDDVVAWAGGLTGVQKQVADQIMARGTPAEVISLLDSYKVAKGITAASPPAAPAAAPPAAPAATPPAARSGTARQAAQAMAAVTTKRPVVGSAAADVNDLDAAWAEAMAADNR